MSNTKISQLPLFTGNTSGSYLVMNDSGQTTTYKVTRENIIGASGTSGTSGTSGSNGTNGSSGTSGDSIFAQTGSFWNTTNNVGITGSLNISGNTVITGSLTVSSSATYDINVIGRMQIRDSASTKFISVVGDGTNPTISLTSSSFITQIRSTDFIIDNNSDRIELTSNSSTGNKTQIRAQDPSNTTQTIVELPCSSSWNGGLTKFKYPVQITGSLTLSQQSPLPTGTVGSLAVSGSNLFYHNGSTWSQIN